MFDNVFNLIVQLKRMVSWYGSILIDGQLTFFDLALWFFILRLIPVFMKMISKMSKKRDRSSSVSEV